MSDHTQTLIFRGTFGSGGVASVVISVASTRLPAVDFSCTDPQPPFEEIINWVKESCVIWSARFDRCAQFVAIFREGACESWTFLPHQPPRCVREEKDPPIHAALRFAAAMLPPTPPGACIHGTPQAKAK